jgi:D-sedoheptulose 7-phosphate isomerase
MQIVTDSEKLFEDAIDAHLETISRLRQHTLRLARLAALMSTAIERHQRIYWLGNGGSAADCQHLAAELVGRFRRERTPIGSIALTTDTSILTAIANDYGYEQIFLRQVEALVTPGDVVIGISTSGNSPNVCVAIRRARDMGALTVALTGRSGGQLGRIAEILFAIDSVDTARIQEAHILCGHMLCDYIETMILKPAKVTTADGGHHD